VFKFFVGASPRHQINFSNLSSNRRSARSLTNYLATTMNASINDVVKDLDFDRTDEDIGEKTTRTDENT